MEFSVWLPALLNRKPTGMPGPMHADIWMLIRHLQCKEFRYLKEIAWWGASKNWQLSTCLAVHARSCQHPIPSFLAHLAQHTSRKGQVIQDWKLKDTHHRYVAPELVQFKEGGAPNWFAGKQGSKQHVWIGSLHWNRQTYMLTAKINTYIGLTI